MNPSTKLTKLAELIETHGFGSLFLFKGQSYDYIIEETNEQISYVCKFDTLYTQNKV